MRNYDRLRIAAPMQKNVPIIGSRPLRSARDVITGAAALAAVAIWLPAVGHAQTYGTAGTDGLDANTNHGNGGHGSDGGDIIGVGNPNITLYGGIGGKGGSAGYISGVGGSAGHGGDARASGDGVINASGGNGGNHGINPNYPWRPTSGAGASSGDGGYAKADSDGQYAGGTFQATAKANGGHGGAGHMTGTAGKGGNAGARADVTATLQAPSTTATAEARGGSGGYVNSPEGGGFAPNGGNATASASASSAFGGNVRASATQHGGNGGYVSNGESHGGNGAPSYMSNLVGGWSQGGNVELTQIAKGGNAGDGAAASSSGTYGSGGTAGNAVSTLVHLPSHSETQYRATAEARGGAGGTAYGGGMSSRGASGEANASLTSTGAIPTYVKANAYGGNGGGGGYGTTGNAYSSGAQGGNADAHTLGRSQSGYVEAGAYAIAGNGGGTNGGLSGAGGNAEAVAQAESDTGTAYAWAHADGGNAGGVSNGATSGLHGTASATATARSGGLVATRHGFVTGGQTIIVDVTARPSIPLGWGVWSDTSVIGSVGSPYTFNHTGWGTHNASQSMTVATGSTYNFQGGTVATPSLVNDGTFEFVGGTLNANVTNNGTFNVRGGGTRTVNGNFVNNGYLKTWDTSFTYTGTFTNNGTYASDPADNFFSDLVVSATGALTGDVGDRFFISGDLQSTSTNNTTWATQRAALHFVGGDGDHVLSITGADLGDSADGYVNNFAWGSLSLATGESLTLVDGNDVVGGALYLAALLLADGLDQLDSITSNGLNIYYDPSLAVNASFGGESYNLTGGGLLAPAAVPEPTVIGMLSVAGLMALRRRR